MNYVNLWIMKKLTFADQVLLEYKNLIDKAIAYKDDSIESILQIASKDSDVSMSMFDLIDAYAYMAQI